jgi:spore coat protein CotH
MDDFEVHESTSEIDGETFKLGKMGKRWYSTFNVENEVQKGERKAHLWMQRWVALAVNDDDWENILWNVEEQIEYFQEWQRLCQQHFGIDRVIGLLEAKAASDREIGEIAEAESIEAKVAEMRAKRDG